MRNILNNCFGEINLDDGNYNAASNPPDGHPTEDDFPNAIDCQIVYGPASGSDGLIRLGRENRSQDFPCLRTIVEGRGASPNITSVDAAGTIIRPTSTQPMAPRAAFNLGLGAFHSVVGWRGVV
jgi:hypothetical protein